MKILFAGNYLPTYNRTAIIRAGLIELGHEVLEYTFQKKNRVVGKILNQKARDCDFVFMPSFTHTDVRFVRSAIGKEKHIVFDPLISRYLTKVFDYKMVSKFGLSALRNFYRDKWPMQTADFVICDTEAHREYFHKTFQIPLNKMGTVYIGNDFNVYDVAGTVQSSGGRFRIGFYGGFIPLQGVLKILEVARSLKNYEQLEFFLIGNGFEYQKAVDFVRRHQLSNVTMPGWLDEGKLKVEIQKFDLALGIFGGTEKSDLVIPNKVYHYGACARPIITQRSTAIQEIFDDKRDLLLTDTKVSSIIESILYLVDNPKVREYLGHNIYQKLKNNYNQSHVARQLVDLYVDNCIKSH